MHSAKFDGPFIFVPALSVESRFFCTFRRLTTLLNFLDDPKFVTTKSLLTNVY